MQFTPNYNLNYFKLEVGDIVRYSDKSDRTITRLSKLSVFTSGGYKQRYYTFNMLIKDGHAEIIKPAI